MTTAERQDLVDLCVNEDQSSAPGITDACTSMVDRISKAGCDYSKGIDYILAVYHGGSTGQVNALTDEIERRCGR